MGSICPQLHLLILMFPTQSNNILLKGIEATYEHYVSPTLQDCPKINLSENKDAQIRTFVKRVIEKKRAEGGQYFTDPTSLAKRYYTGWCGESAVEKYIGKPFVDFSVGDSQSYYVPDLRSAGYEVGVKTVRKGDFPLLEIPSPSRPTTPQVIVIRSSKSDFHICGLATYEVVNDPSNFSVLLVRSRGVLENGLKSAFYRFDKLIPLVP
jgi:hypothetical protein